MGIKGDRDLPHCNAVVRVYRPFGAPAAPPRPGGEVLVVFEGAGPRPPYVIGSLR